MDNTGPGGEELINKVLKYEKEVRLYRKKLERSEQNRAILEDTKDKNQLLLKAVNAEVEEARLTIQKKNEELESLNGQLEKEKEKSESLLLNILPEKIAEELKRNGSVEPVYYESVSVIFTDFKGFTTISEKLCAGEIVTRLHFFFTAFDRICHARGIEKIKTIGDSYMCAGGVPAANSTHAIDSVLAALDFQKFMNDFRAAHAGENPEWRIRLGIHTGHIMAGVVGEKKFAYDIWGDTVNTASRMESSGEPGRVNISGATAAIAGDFFELEHRGKVPAKNKGDIDMYFVTGIRPELSTGGGSVPNARFGELYEKLKTRPAEN